MTLILNQEVNVMPPPVHVFPIYCLCFYRPVSRSAGLFFHPLLSAPLTHAPHLSAAALAYVSSQEALLYFGVPQIDTVG